MKRWAPIALTAAAPFLVAASYAQSYPVKPVRIVSPYTPGGLGDFLPRGVAAGLTELLGQQVIVENRPGASQIIGMQAVAKSPPDGYTLVFGSATSLAINVSAFRNLPYDPLKDFAPIALCFTTPVYLVVHPSVPAKSVNELIALARLRPGRLTFASGGNGSSNHLAGELFKTPYMAQGAASALWDAVVLARCLEHADADGLERAFGLYEVTRKPRASAIQSLSSSNTWLRGQTDPAWIYGYDACSAALGDTVSA